MRGESTHGNEESCSGEEGAESGISDAPAAAEDGTGLSVLSAGAEMSFSVSSVSSGNDAISLDRRTKPASPCAEAWPSRHLSK